MGTLEARTFTVQALIDGLITRNDDAWRRFLHEIGPILQGVCHGWNLSDDDIDDISQLVVLRLLESDCKILRGLKVDSSRAFYAWVKVVVSRVVIDQMRRSRLRSDHEAEWVKERKIGPDPSPSMAERIVVHASLERAVSELPPEDRPLFWMDYHDTSDTEIARIVGMSVTAVEQRLSRMRKKLEQIGLKLELNR